MADDIATEYDDTRPTIAFRATSVRQKARWEKAVADSDEYGSLSHLLRRAVERELADTPTDHSPDTSMSETGGIAPERFAELESAVARIETTLDETKDAVDRVEELSFSEGGADEDTLTDVYAEIPLGEGAVGSDESEWRSIAERVGLPDEKAHFIFEQVYHDIDSVKRKRGTGDTMYYYREV